MPLLHHPEAQSLDCVHGLPDVGLPVVDSGVHFPPPAPSGEQVWLQQSLSTPHAPLSATHCRFEHVPLAHENVQHSLPVTHVVPGSLHWFTGAPHVPVPASPTTQLAVQQSLPLVQESPADLHAPSASGSRPPSVIASMNDESDGIEESGPVAASSAGGMSELESLPQPANTIESVAALDTSANAAHRSLMGTSVVDRSARARPRAGERASFRWVEVAPPHSFKERSKEGSRPLRARSLSDDARRSRVPPLPLAWRRTWRARETARRARSRRGDSPDTSR